MKKRIYALLLALCMVMNMATGVVFADETVTDTTTETPEVETTTPVEPEETVAPEESGHTPGDKEIIKEATCTEEGKWVIYCTDPECGAELESGSIEMTKHVVCEQKCENDYKAATCTEDGYNIISHCTICGTVLEQETISALGHKYETIAAAEPTCTEDGHNEYRICTRVVGEDENGEAIICGAYEEGHEMEVIPATGHGDPEIKDGQIECDPDKTDDESIDSSVEYICSKCGEVVEEAVDVPAPHTWEYFEAVDSTCTEEGHTAYRMCTVCDRVEGYEVIEMKEHDYQYYGAQAGSCTQDGARAGWKCSVCGAAHPDKPYPEAIKAPGHTYEEMEGLEPTCTEDGYTDYEKCSVCGYENDKEVIPAAGHDWKMVIGTPATCTTDGIGAHEACSVCGVKEEGYEEFIIPAHGHSNEDGYYPEWMMYEEEIISGNAAEFYEKAGEVRSYTKDGVNALHVIAEELCEYDEEGNLITSDKRKAARVRLYKIKCWTVSDGAARRLLFYAGDLMR